MDGMLQRTTHPSLGDGVVQQTHDVLPLHGFAPEAFGPSHEARRRQPVLWGDTRSV